MILLAALLLIDPVAALDTELQASNSATAVLQKRCSTPIKAEVDRSVQKDAPDAVRADLGAVEGVALTYRLVRLKCGHIVYSRAENWYRPDGLTDQMNAALLSGDAPFGVVIKPLLPTRQTLGSERPEEEGTVLRHRAMVISGEGRPLAEVVESYTPEFLFAAKVD